MSDYDRNGQLPPERETVRESDTTIIHTDTGRSRGGGGTIIAVVLLLAVLALLFYLFGGGLNNAADEVGVNVNVDMPKVEMPDVEIPDVKVPDVDIDIDGDEEKSK